MTRRLMFLALVVIGVGTPTALACNEPSLGSVTPTARAGSPVSFSAVNLDPGASYTLLLGGQAVAAGIAEGEAASGSFSMPDLGRPQTVFLELHVAHDGGTWVSSRPVEFQVPAPAAAKPQSHPGSEAASAPKTKARAKSETAAPAELSKAADARAVPAAAPAAVQPAVKPQKVKAAAAKKEPASAAYEKPLQVLPDLLPVLAVPTPPSDEAAPAPVVASPTRATDPIIVASAPERRTPLVWILLAATLLLGFGAGAYAAVRRGRRLREAAIEAELQEMIAEARAARSTGLRLR